MKKLKSTFLNMVLSLGSVSVVMGAILAYVNSATADEIARIKEQALNDGIKAVILEEGGDLTVQDTQEADGMVLYATADAAGNYLGTAVKSTVNGFGGPLVVLVGFDAQGNIRGYRVLESQETPGLGAKADSWFQKGGKGDIIGMNPGTNNMTVKKDEGEVDAITASTITSRAFLNAVNNAYNAFMGKAAADGQSGATPQAAADQEPADQEAADQEPADQEAADQEAAEPAADAAAQEPAANN